MKEISTMVLELWEQEKLPLIGNLLLADGRLYKNIMSNTAYQCKPFEASSRDYASWFSHINVLQSATYQDYLIYCGNGSYGSDGFILVLKADHSLHWLMIDDINPIERFTIQNGIIHAHNNLKQEFIIPITVPENYRTINHFLWFT